MKSYCPKCGKTTPQAVNYERGERICKSCNHVMGF